MKLFYETMTTPELIEFTVEVQGRRIMKTIQLNAYKKVDAELIRLLKNRLSIEGDRLRDVKSFTFYDKRKKISVHRVTTLPIKDDLAQKELNYLIYEAREVAKKEGVADEH